MTHENRRIEGTLSLETINIGQIQRAQSICGAAANFGASATSVRDELAQGKLVASAR